MKITCIAIVVLGLFSCQNEVPKDYVTLSGKIINKNRKPLTIRGGEKGGMKTITIQEDGTFSDTLKITKGNNRFLRYGREMRWVYLKNGFDLKMTFDAKDFDATLAYKGIGAEVNNYLAKIAMLKNSIYYDKAIFEMEEAKFEVKIKEFVGNCLTLLKSTEKIEASFIADQQEKIEVFSKKMLKNYKEKLYLRTVLGKGKKSPKFVDFENYNKEKTSLDDLKGKYVYIDVWATWCGPCKAEIPFLKKIEEEYRDKNIEFVSLSVDKEKDHEAWVKMIEEKELKGIQLFADKGWKSSFVQEYKIKGIPRFILIDPEGNIVSSKAPRPSSDDLKILFDELSL